MQTRVRALITASVIAGTLATMGSPAGATGPEPFGPRDGRSITRGSQLNGSAGIDVGSDGNVYTASVFGGEITVHDSRSGAIIDRIGPERGVDVPDDVTLAPDGTLYWTELGGNVAMLAPGSSTPREQFVGAGVNPIAMSDDGRLFVALRAPGTGLYELDPNLELPPRLISADPDDFNGMDFGPDGLLYAPLFTGGDIVRIDVDAVDPVPEVVATGFDMPGGVAFDSHGLLYVVDFFRSTVSRVDVATGVVQELADIGGVFDNIAIDSRDRIFVTDVGNGAIWRLSLRGTMHEFHRGGLVQPEGIAVSSDGTVYVANLLSLHEYASKRQAPTRIAYMEGVEPPLRGSTDTVAVDGDSLITAGWYSNSVQVLNHATLEVQEDIRTVATPLNAIRHGELLVAAQLGGGNVVDAHTGAEILGGLTYPLGLASDGTTLYVSDRATGDIWSVPASGPATRLATGLSAPEGLALDGTRLLVVEEGLDRVVAIDIATGTLSPVIVGLDLGQRVAAGFLAQGLFNGVAVGPDRSIYVTTDGTNGTLVFRR